MGTPSEELNGKDPSATKPDAKIIALLDAYLAKARAGKLNALALIASKADGSRAFETCAPDQQYLGNLAMGIIALYFALGASIANAHKGQK